MLGPDPNMSIMLTPISTQPQSEQAYCEQYLEWDKDERSIKFVGMHTRKPSVGSHDEEVSILRSLLSLAERVLYLPEALYDIILILRFYVFQGEKKRVRYRCSSEIRMDIRFAKQWLFTE